MDSVDCMKNMKLFIIIAARMVVGKFIIVCLREPLGKIIPKLRLFTLD